MVPVHVVIVGCGRVGSGLAVGLVEQGHTVSIIDKVARAFRRLPADWPGTPIVGSGFDRDDLDRAGAKQRRRPGRGDERGQLEHPDGPDRPGELRHRTTSWPGSTTPAGPRSTSDWASPPWPR